jgi:hypothetical protein
MSKKILLYLILKKFLKYGFYWFSTLLNILYINFQQHDRLSLKTLNKEVKYIIIKFIICVFPKKREKKISRYQKFKHLNFGIKCDLSLQWAINISKIHSSSGRMISLKNGEKKEKLQLLYKVKCLQELSYLIK